MSLQAALRRGGPALVAAAALAGCFGGGSAGPLTGEDLQRAYDQFGQVIERAEAGDVDGADEILTEVRETTRRIGESLNDNPMDVIVGAELFDALILISQEMSANRRGDVIAGYAEDAQLAITDAAEALGFQRPQ